MDALFPSVSDVLDLDVLKFALPTVVGGGGGLGRLVRWVHAGEIADIAQYLGGGELLLTTGIALPTDDSGLRRYVAELDDVEAAGLMVGLGRRFLSADLPKGLLAAADRRQLPIVVLGRETPFVRVSTVVNRIIVNSQVEQLEASEAIHRTFTEISVEGAEPAEVVRQAARMAKRPVVLESLAHQVLAYDAAEIDPALVIDDWERRSRSARIGGRTGYDEASKWLVTVVGARGQDWGRLILLTDGAPSAREVMLLERAATTLALNRLVTRDLESLERESHRNLVTDLLTHAHPVEELALRARALGVPLRGRRLLGMVVRSATSTPAGVLTKRRLSQEIADAVFQALVSIGIQGLAGAVAEGLVEVVLSLGSRESEAAVLDRFASALNQSLADSVVIGVGSCVTDLSDARRSLLEAEQVADAAMYAPGHKQYYRLADVQLRGLLHLLRDDARLQTFVERELGPLLAYDQRHSTHLLDALTLYLEHGRNKSAAAEACFMSRASFYHQLVKIEHILQTDLSLVETCVSLHVAVLAHRLMHS
jgi:PucR family transcriptional regulator, purine catabolism regulatory protein